MDILGLLIVAIMLMAKVSALSMAVLERTREVGILRCTGARSRQIRRIFSAEALTLALAGWALGVLVGWLIYEGLLALIQHDLSLSLPREFGPVGLLGTLAGVVVLTLLVIRGPLRRATRDPAWPGPPVPVEVSWLAVRVRPGLSGGADDGHHTGRDGPGRGSGPGPDSGRAGQQGAAGRRAGR